MPRPAIRIAPSIKPQFQTFQPEDTMNDLGFRKFLPRKANRLARTKDSSDGLACADFPRQLMEAQRGLIGIYPLTDAIDGGGNHVAFTQRVS